MDRSTGNVDSGIFRFFERECRIGQGLLGTVRRDIGDISDVCAEIIKPTNRLRSVMKSLNDGRIPALEWGGRYTTPSVMLAASWVQDFGKRLQQLITLTDNKATPLSQTDWARRGVWLGGLFSPKAFITATRQETAAQLNCSVQELRLVVRTTARELHVVHVGQCRVASLLGVVLRLLRIPAVPGRVCGSVADVRLSWCVVVEVGWLVGRSDGWLVGVAWRGVA